MFGSLGMLQQLFGIGQNPPLLFEALVFPRLEFGRLDLPELKGHQLPFPGYPLLMGLELPKLLFYLHEPSKAVLID